MKNLEQQTCPNCWGYQLYDEQLDITIQNCITENNN